MMKKNRLLLFTLAMIASFVIAGCTSSSSESTSGTGASGKETVPVRMAIDTAAGGS